MARKNGCGSISIAISTMVLVAAFVAFPGGIVRVAAQSGQEAEVNCRFAAVSYREGTVIQGDRIPEQMCVRASNPGGQGYHAEWIRMSKEARERSSSVVIPPNASPLKNLAVPCTPRTTDTKDACGCEGLPDLASGQLVRSDRGAMKCEQGEWRPLASCIAYETEYPEGTVIRTGADVEQMCVRVLSMPANRQSRETHLDWVRSSKELRERGNKALFVILNSAPCKPAPAKSPGSCGCEGFSDFAPTSVVPSANGPIRCEDGEWKPVSKDSVTK